MFELEQQARKTQDSLIIEQSKLATMGEMIGYMAHQWKQPLNILNLCFEEINDVIESSGLKDDNLSNTVTEGMRQLYYMAETIDDFRNYLKPDKGGAEPFNVNLATLEVLKLIGSYITKNGIKLKFVCRTSDEHVNDPRVMHENILWYCSKGAPTCNDCSSLPDMMVKGFVNEYKQVIINLINNSRDAIEQKSKENTWHTDEEIIISTEVVGEDLAIRISDTAGGIPEEIQDKIFEPYFSTKAESGTGIGLSMVKNILEENFGGSLEFCNIDKGGVEFTLKVKINQ